MYRQPQPELQNVDFDLCLRLAEATEKYLVHSAIPAVKLRLQGFIQRHPLQILDYAGRHNYTELATEAARSSMSLPVADALRVLAPDNLVKWALFFDQWHEDSFQLRNRMRDYTQTQTVWTSGVN
ncbi:hypothetical protein B0H11DRAFT_2261257 [Mycena galericulata]|nr:hypothetical protein B0H11DRAFT_2261257 [Mycena galericulata]